MSDDNKMTNVEINMLIDKLIYIKDHYLEYREDRDAINDACNLIERNKKLLASDTN